ncbi:MAG TPA: hypothetical protein DCS66_24845 [Flavobacteriaceae bacterium]|nr:hypothetical protein [Flavobacteriaceae bacterium]HAT67788.1 hypothetical protein [Flavobacteriaceae bacterium]|tara:strand:+ start:300 stop:1079 length:780 start_codon:yes stop_codon:yes gene_type:complete
MIKFFRKIRQKLLSENKFSKYFMYALGEIILVVIGILIALQINGWNTHRVNKNKEQEYLVGLKSDLENQINAFNGRIKIYDVIIDKGESIVTDFATAGKLIEIDSINIKLSYMMYALNYPDTQTTFNELIATGQINLIQEKSLRSKIIRYYQDSEDSKSNVNSNVESVFYQHIFPIIKSSIIVHFDNFQFKSEKVNKELLNEKLITTFETNLRDPFKEFEVINAVSLRVMEANTNKGHILFAKDLAQTLLRDIESELSK